MNHEDVADAIDDLKLDSSTTYQSFGKLRQLTASFITQLPGNSRRRRYAFYECSCGVLFRTRYEFVLSEDVTSCPKCSRARSVHAISHESGSNHPSCTHGLSSSPEHRAYKNMLYRCGYEGNCADPSYLNVTVCDEWLVSYDSFLVSVGPRPEEGYELDRVDGTKGYQPGNCQWLSKEDHGRKSAIERWRPE